MFLFTDAQASCKTAVASVISKLWSILMHYKLTHSGFALGTRNSSGDEIANVNFLYDDIVHAVKIQ